MGSKRAAKRAAKAWRASPHRQLPGHSSVSRLDRVCMHWRERANSWDGNGREIEPNPKFHSLGAKKR
jgi:hypothetical protein